MNPKPMSEAEAIRSDIEMTRRRMDETVDALSERMHGRHLLDEVIGLFRSSSNDSSDSENIMQSETASRVREKLSSAAGKISDTASDAANAVVDTVKNNPLPVLLIAGGAAWLAYSATKGRRVDMDDMDEDLEDENRYDPDTHYDRPIEYPAAGMTSAGDTGEGMADEADSKFQQMKNTVKDKLSGVSDAARDKFQAVKERANDLGNQVSDRASAMYGKTRDAVVNTADEHPLPLGLGCLALGILVGLALPTPAPVNRVAGPTVDRLRNRTRDAGRQMLEKGKRVVQAATDAAKNEAQSQGLTPDRLRQSLSSVGNQAAQAASDTAHQEGIMGGEPRAGAEPADPSAARPAM